MNGHSFFWIALSFLIVHEMDAVRCREWRIMPGLSRLNDTIGQQVFIIAHIPILGVLFYQLNQGLSVQFWGIYTVLNSFMILHVFLHIVFVNHKKNEFRGKLSWFLIIGAGMFAVFDLFGNYL